MTVDANNAFTMPDDDVEFTGAWTANTYTVTLVTNGGAINSGNVTSYTYGVGATLPADVTQTAKTVQTFCNQHGLSRKAGIHAGLCLEEIAGNIVRYGFRADRRRHDIEVRVVLKEQDVTLRIKDDCVPFNPQEWHEMTSSGTDPTKNVGIRLVYGIADEVEYRSMLGMNVLTIVVAAHNLKESRYRAAGAAGTSG